MYPAKDYFTKGARREIAQAIDEAERSTSGEIRVMIINRCDADLEGSVYGQAVREFERQGMTKTRERTGVLILLVWEERKFAIVGDTGIHAVLGDVYWEARATEMARHFRGGDYVHGIEHMVRDVGMELALHFPRKADDRDELPDAPIVEDNR